MAQERRRWRRVDCDASKQGVLLRLETQDARDPVRNTMARDISVGGLSFEVEKSVILSKPLPLKVFLPACPATFGFAKRSRRGAGRPHAHSPLDCPSRIAWQKANEHTIRAGVAFLELSEEQQRCLSDFLREVGGPTATVELAPPPHLSRSRLGVRISEPVRRHRDIGAKTDIEQKGAGPAAVEEAKPPRLVRRGSRRDQAIQQFEQGVLLYHQHKFGQARREFQKVVKEYADVIDVARVARRYHDWCEEE